eukprot:4482757-Pyramimonas_sp.AAC.1
MPEHSPCVDDADKTFVYACGTSSTFATRILTTSNGKGGRKGGRNGVSFVPVSRHHAPDDDEVHGLGFGAQFRGQLRQFDVEPPLWVDLAVGKFQGWNGDSGVSADHLRVSRNPSSAR